MHRNPEQNKRLTLLLSACLTFMNPSHLIADSLINELDHPDETADIDNDIDENAEDSIPPIEVGPAGNISRESPYRTEAEEQSPVHFHAMWETRYITEGRDNLSGNSLLAFSTDLSYDNFTFAPWIAGSAYTDYLELNLNLV